MALDKIVIASRSNIELRGGWQVYLGIDYENRIEQRTVREKV